MDCTPFHLNHLAADKSLQKFCGDFKLDLDRDDIFLELTEESAKAAISEIFDAIIMKAPPKVNSYFSTLNEIILKKINTGKSSTVDWSWSSSYCF